MKGLSVIAILAGIGFITAVGYGWVMNIVKLLSAESYDGIAQIVLGVAGVFMAPLGALVYYVAG